MVQLEEARAAIAAEWHAHDPRTPDEIADFYKHATGYVDDLNAWHETEGRKFLTGIVLAAADACRATSVLDVGCGMGHDLAALREHNPGLILVGVEPNDGMRNSIPRDVAMTCSSLDDVMGDAKFDMAVCMDILEHVPDPDALLDQIIARLRPEGGIIVEHSPVHDVDQPMHLPTLRAWHPGRMLDAHGFRLEEKVGDVNIWRRYQIKRIEREHIIICAYRAMSVATVEALAGLIEGGWRFSIHHGDALVSRVRSVAVSQWYKQTAGDVFLMVDDDVIYAPEEAQRVVDLARSTRAIASGAYPVRDGSHLASAALEGHEDIIFGQAEPQEIKWAGTGFIAVHRDVIDAMVKTLPLTQAADTWSFWPLFMPFVYGEGDAALYLSEDWAFCERARQLGFKVWLEPTVELRHIGQREYTVREMHGVEPVPATDVMGA